jgi:hypothetical protein
MPIQFFPFPPFLFGLLVSEALTLLVITLGLFIMVYFIMMVYAGMNPWVREVKRMEWCCNPAFDVWYFEHNRRKWVAANIGLSTVMATIFWTLSLILNSFYYIPLYGESIFFLNAFLGYILGIGFLIPIGYGIFRLHA